MWRDPRLEESNLIPCPRCNELCEINYELFTRWAVRKYEICNTPQKCFKFKCQFCGYDVSISQRRHAQSSHKKSKNENKEFPDSCKSSILKNISNYKSILIIGILIAIILWYLYTFFIGNTEGENVALIDKLKEDYPSQKKETWYHFMGILEKEIPSVKSIVFLHGKDKETSDCLANKLVFLFSKNKNIKNEDITFSNFKADDYGFILQHYYTIIKKFRVFITDLNKVSGNVARIFHSLCDEVSSDIKPSLFIFTLKYEGKTESLRPIERATSLLRKAWNDLPESELSPLLSRIVKNVVDIVPEHQINC